MQSIINKINAAIEAFKQGKPIILTDHPDRENEGDLIIPAEIITADIMNFMIRQGTGIVCMAMTAQQLQTLHIPLMIRAEENSSLRETPFSISVDAKDGISTGVSAADRVKTVLTLMAEQTTPDDVVKPGHIFPLQAKDGGVLERAGHTEGSIDIARLAGFKPAAVLCEIMNPDGTMASGDDLEQFALQHALPILSIDELIIYRRAHENLIADEAHATLPLENLGEFEMTVLREKYNQQEHIVLSKPVLATHGTPLVRIHSACMTGDLFHSQRCDCNQQLRHALQQINQHGGLLIYLAQEGRGIGLFNKIRAYHLQEKGFNTIEANQELGLPVDAREYYIAANILRNRNMLTIRLMTNNLDKINSLKKYGIQEVRIESMPNFVNSINKDYLLTKTTLTSAVCADTFYSSPGKEHYA